MWESRDQGARGRRVSPTHPYNPSTVDVLCISQPDLIQALGAGRFRGKQLIHQADLEKLRTPPDCCLMLRLGSARRKPRAPPSLWVVAAFLVTVALLFTSFPNSFIQSLAEVSREKEKQVPSTRGLAVTIPLPAGLAGDPLQIGNAGAERKLLTPLTPATFEGTVAKEKPDSEPGAAVKVAASSAQS